MITACVPASRSTDCLEPVGHRSCSASILTVAALTHLAVDTALRGKQSEMWRVKSQEGLGTFIVKLFGKGLTTFAPFTDRACLNALPSSTPSVQGHHQIPFKTGAVAPPLRADAWS